MPDDTTNPTGTPQYGGASTPAPVEAVGEPDELDPQDELAVQIALQDRHSDAVGMLDVHSVAVDPALVKQPTGPLSTNGTDGAGGAAEPTPPTETQPPTDAATPAPVTVAPVVGATVQATKQATQTAVQATKQVTQAAAAVTKHATQQVAGAVQQQAQKITVAPRKALYRGKRFMFIYGGLVGAAGLLAILAKRYKYFPADVGITRILQKPNNMLYDRLMYAVSELGWRWISVGTRASLTTLMWAAGFRMESAFTLSTWSGDLMTIAIKTRVLRPRPTKDLVRVVSDLQEASFPSGHVVHYVTFYGFLFYLVFTHLKQRWFRTALLTLLAGVILLIGPSRIYMGHHWPSDVGGAYLVGTLWLGVIIIAYLETKGHYTLHTRPPFFIKRPQQLG